MRACVRACVSGKLELVLWKKNATSVTNVYLPNLSRDRHNT